MKKIMSLALVGFALLGCREFDAKLVVFEKFKPVVKKGQKEIPAGTYNAKLKIKKKEAELEVKMSGDKNNPELEIKIPKHAQLPDYSGPISLKAGETGQTFDLEGALDARTTDSRPYRQQEQCSEQVPERHCYHTPQGTRCETRYVTRHGWRDVEFFERTTVRNLQLALINPSDRRQLAQLSGVNSETQRIITYQGYCRIY